VLDSHLLAAAIDSREAYDRVSPYIGAKDLTPPAAFWWQLVQEWYGRERDSPTVNRDLLLELGLSRIPNPKQRDTLVGFLRDSSAGGSPANVAAVALELKRKNAGMELAQAIANNDGKAQQRLVKIYADLMAATELKGQANDKRAKFEEAASVEDVFRLVGSEQRIPLAPTRLNSRINGGAIPGHHIVLYGRPEMGKSTFSVNFAVGLAIKQNRRVLYVGNEDQINILKQRAIARAVGMTSDEVNQKRDEAIKVYRDRGGEDRLRFVQMFDGGPDDLRQIIDRHEPQIIVLDQIRNLSGVGDGLVSKLEENGQAFRRLLLEYGLVGLSVAQAGGSADGKTWLGMNDLDSSKTGLPGTADLMIGMGASQEMLNRNQRALSFPKNKLSSSPSAKEGLLVDIDTSRSSIV
jgi:AAA domain